MCDAYALKSNCEFHLTRTAVVTLQKKVEKMFMQLLCTAVDSMERRTLKKLDVTRVRRLLRQMVIGKLNTVTNSCKDLDGVHEGLPKKMGMRQLKMMRPTLRITGDSFGTIIALYTDIVKLALGSLHRTDGKARLTPTELETQLGALPCFA